MRTRFTEAQLGDPDLAVAAEQLRSCVHCGFCLPACPTYAVTGNELDSPRGRIVLMQELLQSEEVGPAVVTHLDRCLSCLACQTVCPSGVDYMHLVDHARARIEAAPARSALQRWQRAVLGWLLPRPAAFRWALVGLPLGRALSPLLPAWMRSWLQLAPAQRIRRFDPAGAGVAAPVVAPEQPQVALLVGCVQSVLDADVHDATVRVLQSLGARVVQIRGLGCCGAVAHHLGQHQTTVERVRANVAALQPHLEHLQAVVSTVSGCGTMLEDYAHLLRDDPLAPAAARVSELSMDVLEVVQLLGLPEDAVAPEPKRVAYHAACSLQHGQGVRSLPVELLRGLGHTVVQPADAHLCCGSAGTYNLLQPELAAQLGDRKAEALRAVAADVIAAGNVGCALQIGGRVAVAVRHPIQLIDDALETRRPPG
ncbi:MAG: glycolate oxidase subunit GlcF [Myxococcales bacterium]|nr:glycolate oxidase subunit GlcF [Myxococcales bacterium]